MVHACLLDMFVLGSSSIHFFFFIHERNLYMFCPRRYTAVEKELGRLREDFEQEMRSLKNKHEANVEFIKQEHNNQVSKVNIN